MDKFGESFSKKDRMGKELKKSEIIDKEKSDKSCSKIANEIKNAEKRFYGKSSQDDQVRSLTLPTKPDDMRDDEFARKESNKRGWEPSCGMHIIKFLTDSTDLDVDNTRFSRRKHMKGPCEPKFCSMATRTTTEFAMITAYEIGISATLGRQMGDTFDLSILLSKNQASTIIPKFLDFFSNSSKPDFKKLRPDASSAS
jgi:hypothetical protein